MQKLIKKAVTTRWLISVTMATAIAFSLVHTLWDPVVPSSVLSQGMWMPVLTWELWLLQRCLFIKFDIHIFNGLDTYYNYTNIIAVKFRCDFPVSWYNRGRKFVYTKNHGFSPFRVGRENEAKRKRGRKSWLMQIHGHYHWRARIRSISIKNVQ